MNDLFLPPYLHKVGLYLFFLHYITLHSADTYLKQLPISAINNEENYSKNTKNPTISFKKPNQ